MPLPHPGRPRRGAVAVTAPIAPVAPTICENGYTLYPPRPLGGVVGPLPRHVVPVYDMATSLNPYGQVPIGSGNFPQGTYLPPTNVCSTRSLRTPDEVVTGGQGCNYCNQQWLNLFCLVRDSGCSTYFVREEELLSRRLAYAEFMLLINHCNAVGRSVFQRLCATCALTPASSLLEAVGAAEKARIREQARIQAEQQREWERHRRQQAKAANEARRKAIAAAAERVKVGKFLVSEPPKDEIVTVQQARNLGLRVRRRRVSECECERHYDDDDDCTVFETDSGRCECGYESGDPNEQLLSHPKHGEPFYAGKADKNRRLIGVELEFNELVNLDKWVSKWRGSIHEDGSCGWEAVTTPIAGCHVDQCIRDLTRAIRNEGGEADDRCGIHVHVDAGDIAWADMLRILAVYVRVEPILYLLAGQQRMTGQYCAPCGPEFGQALATDDPKNGVLDVALNAMRNRGVDGRAAARDGIAKKDGGRYKGINIIPWLAGRRNGKADTTIEFRLHRNSLDANRIVGWAKLCADIVEWCSKATDADVTALPKSALRALCEVISPASKPWIIRRVTDWRKATTAERSKKGRTKTLDGGGIAAARKIKLKGGVYACAV